MRAARLTAIALVAGGLAIASAARADDGTKTLKFAPKDTAIAIAIDTDGLEKSAIYGQVLGLLTSDSGTQRDLAKLTRATGFDATRDLSSLVIFLPPDFDDSENFLAIGRGKFNSKRLVAFAKSEGGKQVARKHRGQTWYEIDGEGGLAFISDYAILGTKGYVTRAIDVYKGKAASIRKNPAMARMLKAVDTRATVWMVSTVPASITKDLARELPPAASLVRAHGSIDLTSGLKLRLTAAFKDAKTATQLAAMANQGLTQVKAEPQLKAMGLESIVNKLSITAKNDLMVSLDISAAEVQKLWGMVQAML